DGRQEDICDIGCETQVVGADPVQQVLQRMCEFLGEFQIKDRGIALKRVDYAEDGIHQLDVLRVQLELEQRLFHLDEAFPGLRHKALQQQFVIDFHLYYSESFLSPKFAGTRLRRRRS